MTWPRFALLLVVAIACAHALLPGPRHAAAVRELLAAAVDGTVARLAREGGFDDPAAARVDAAAQLGPLARALHGTGMGGRVLALDAALRRAGERATSELAPWLREQAAGFAAPDPGAVLEGPNGAAALAFRAAVEPRLAERLAPVAAAAAEAAGVGEELARVREGAARLPLPRDVALDPPALVSERVREAFFEVLAEEEARARAARAEGA